MQDAAVSTYSLEDLCEGLGKLAHTSVYLSAQFSPKMPPHVLQAHFEARDLLVKIRNRALKDAEEAA